MPSLGCNYHQMAQCTSLQGAYAFMGHWENGAGCGLNGGNLCHQGTNMMGQWALCMRP